MNPRYPRIAERAGHRCEYCLAPEDMFNFPFEVEHVIPPNRGGPDDDGNLALACRACNVFKGDAVEAADPETGTTVPLYHPRRDTWSGHFRFVNDTGGIIGLTHVGRASVERLKMNSAAQRTARLRWARLGWYP